MDGCTAGEFMRPGPCVAGRIKPAAFIRIGRLGSSDAPGIRRDRKGEESGCRRTGNAEDGTARAIFEEHVGVPRKIRLGVRIGAGGGLLQFVADLAVADLAKDAG